jgi:hypothetical protein
VVVVTDKFRTKALTAISDEGGAIFIEYKSRRFALKITGLDLATFWNVILLLDGEHSVAEIARILELPSLDLENLIGRLCQLGLAQQVSYPQTSDVSPDRFLEDFLATATMWKRHIFRRPVFDRIIQQPGHLNLLRGLLLETYHYIGMTEAAIKAAREEHIDSAVGCIIDELANSEDDHQKLLLACLSSAGVKTDSIDSWMPLPSTIAVGAFIENTARSDSLGFLSLFCISEAYETEHRSAVTYLDKVEDANSLRRGALDGLREHLSADVSASHSNVFAKAIELLDGIDLTFAERMINTIHTYKHLLEIWYDEIYETYGGLHSPFIPHKFAKLMDIQD